MLTLILALLASASVFVVMHLLAKVMCPERPCPKAAARKLPRDWNGITEISPLY
jgi:hypothetical protein